MYSKLMRKSAFQWLFFLRLWLAQPWYFNVPELFVRTDIAICEKRYPGEVQILMLDEHTHGQ